MIHSITIENYQSIKNKTTLNMVVDGNAPTSTKYLNSLGTRISSVEALIGPNASGKTTILRSLEVVRYFIKDSLIAPKPMGILYQPYAVRQPQAKKPTSFNVVFGSSDETYDYTLKLHRGRIIHESMSLKSLANVRAVNKKIFTRQWFDKSESYEVSSPGFENKMFNTIQASQAATASMVAIASFFGDPLAINVSEYWSHVMTNISFMPVFNFYGSEAYSVLSELSENDEESKDLIKQVISYLPMVKEYDYEDQFFVQADGNNKFHVQIPQLSSGSQQLVVVLSKLQHVLAHGGVAIIDEFDAYLHPTWLKDLVTQFFDKNKNSKDAQLIMSTHSVQIINELDKYQINIVENESGHTDIVRLDEIEGVRSVEDFFGNYMSGKYGGIPVTP